MNILYVEPVGHDLFSSHFTDLLRQLAHPDIKVDVTHLALAHPVTSPFLPSSPEYQGALFARIRRAEAEGYDGVIIGCSSDPGLREARRSVRIPVVAPFASALHLATMRAERVGVVTPGPQREVIWLWDCVRTYGLAHQVASITIAEVGHPIEDEVLARRMGTDPVGVREEILAAHRRSVALDGAARRAAVQLVEEHGVEVLVFACTFWSGMLAPIRKALGVAVVDPCEAPLRVAETLAASGPPRGTGLS